jgi:hypothetical protein
MFNNKARIGQSLTLGLLLVYMVNAIMWLAQDLMSRGLFLTEMTVLWMTVFQTAQLVALPGQVQARMTVLRVQMTSIDHSHNSALHWTISLLAGFVLSAIIGQTFTGAVPWNLNNWAANNWAVFPIYGVTFIFGTGLVYWLLAR